MLLGLHVSIAKSIVLAPLRAAGRGAEVFQMFSRSPHGGAKIELTAELIKQFKANLKKSGIKEFYIHAPYFINLGSSNNRIYHGSIAALRDELERGSKLGAKYMMFHPGSGKDLGREKALALVIKGIDKILDGYSGKCELLIESSAGAGEILADKFEEIAAILKTIKSNQAGVCLDTCHAFATGYDLRTAEDVEHLVREFDQVIGLNKLKLLHFNDSKAKLGERKDRHEAIGQGQIGATGFQALINHPKLKKINAVLETPDVMDEPCASLELIKKLRK